MEYRQIDRPTDVLSFSLLEGEPLADEGEEELLGDVVISLPAAMRQGKEYGHGIEREAAYLTVHGMLHLLGYDHEDDEGKALMREKEETVLNRIKLYPGIIQAALLARENAYAPYSGFRVGAALLTDAGRLYTGCNVENSSYGLTCCAERVALFKAVSEEERGFTAMAVASDSEDYCKPCGACRQVLAEFAYDMKVYMCNCHGDFKEITVRQLLPESFRLGEEK